MIPPPYNLSMSAAPAEEEEVFASLSILLQILLLGISFIVGHILRRRKFYYMHEASAALTIGLIAGAIANIWNKEEKFRKWLNFREEFFLLFLLPPIIFESGFSLQVRPFFNNFGAICSFALLGTLISALVVGVLVWLGGCLFLIYRLPFLESLIFGAIISATDPVTVLAIFQELGTNTNLYALVFGESVLNDAVAIVMYRTLVSILKNPAADYNLFSSFQFAIVTFVGSLSIGVFVALTCALLFKYAALSVRNLQNLECCLIVLFPYISYMVAEGFSLSGIVAILFCGILMKHYTFPNLSDTAQTLCAGFFQLISSLAETFTFIYMGVDIALGESQSWSHISFILFSILFICIARAANVFPLAYVVNLMRPRGKRIPGSHQKALWFSGLRGAMAFALALQSVHDLQSGHGEAIFTATTAIVMLTVFVIGGSTATMLEELDLVGDQLDKSASESEDGSEEELLHLTSLLNEDDGLDPAISPHEMLQRRLRMISEQTPSFSTLDSKYIRPFFTAQSEDGDHRSLAGDSGEDELDMPYGNSSSYKTSASQRTKATDLPLPKPNERRQIGNPKSAQVTHLPVKAAQQSESLSRSSLAETWRQSPLQTSSNSSNSNLGENRSVSARSTSPKPVEEKPSITSTKSMR